MAVLMVDGVVACTLNFEDYDLSFRLTPEQWAQERNRPTTGKDPEAVRRIAEARAEVSEP